MGLKSSFFIKILRILWYNRFRFGRDGAIRPKPHLYQDEAYEI